MISAPLEKILLLGREVKEERYALESRWTANKFPFKAIITEVKKSGNLLGQPPGIYWELWPADALSNGRTYLGKGTSANLEEASSEVERLAIGLGHDLAYFLPQTSITGL